VGVTRREFIRSTTAISVGALAGVGAYGVAYERHQIERIVRDLAVRGLPPALDGLRIGMITDVHHSASVPPDDVTRAVMLLKEAAPDIVVLGGDYISFFDRTFIGPVAELLAPLANAPYGSFAVLGNHDDEKEVPPALSSRGFTVLKDQRTSLTIKGERLDLAGIRFWTRTPREIAGVLSGTGGTTVLLAHDPRRLVEAAALDVQLVLSGHTHGGQIYFKGITDRIMRRIGLNYHRGFFTFGDTTLYVTPGVGFSGIPRRIGPGTEAEVAIITLRAA